MWWWGLLSLAWGQQDPGLRRILHEALVQEGVYGDVQGASTLYQRLVRNRSLDEEGRSEALHRLGRALYDLGRADLARSLLIDGRAAGVCDTRCLDLLQAVVIESEAITTIPTEWDFAARRHGLFHPLDQQARGAIRLIRRSGGGVLQWTTSEFRRGDHLVMGFERPLPAPTELELAAASEPFGVSLDVVASDEEGRIYRLPAPVRLPAGQAVRDVVILTELRPTAPTDPPLDTSRLTRVMLEMAQVGGTPNRVDITVLEVR